MFQGIPHSESLFPFNSTPSKQVAFLLRALGLPADCPEAHLKKLSGGFTNAVYSFECPQQRYVVRVYGNSTELIINRREEIENILKIGFTSVYATFPNGLIVSYQKGCPMDVPMMADPEISDKVAATLARLHRVTLAETGHANELFGRIGRFLDGLDPSRPGLDVAELRRRVEALRRETEKELSDSVIVLCHCDLLAGNLLWDEDAATVNIIDYEYSDWTWPEFDIANHFFEWCGFECELARFPSIAQQKTFIRRYLTVLFGKQPTDAEVDEWQRRVALCVPASGIFWGTWGFFQDQNSAVKFPYLEYGKIRTMVAEYSLPLPEGHCLRAEPLVRLDEKIPPSNLITYGH
jgi:ethanolamine kinase